MSWPQRRRKGAIESAGYLCFLLLVVFIIDSVSIGQHALMQYARNHNATALRAVKHNVRAMLMTVQAGANVINESAKRQIVRKGLATNFKFAYVAGGLGLAPFMKGVIGDDQLLRGARIETCPWLSRHGKLQGLTDTAEYIALGDTAGVAFVNSRP
jgi:hypothetical protein